MSTKVTPQYILDSKQMCQQSGMDPNEVRKPSVNMTAHQLEKKTEII